MDVSVCEYAANGTDAFLYIYVCVYVQVKAREAITFKQTPWKDGQPQQTVLTDNTGSHY